jgi:NADH dehydrogenase
MSDAARGGEGAAGRRPRVVIVGAGFGGLACARALGNAPVDVTVIDRHNYHLFVPLIYQVATAALSPADIAKPIRRMLARYPNISVMLGEVTGVDLDTRRVRLADGGTVAFDTLVIATGSAYSYFGHDEWQKIAPGPRSIENARVIRARLLRAFERAEICPDPKEQEALLTTIIVGGGPTGVEMAGSVGELARFSLRRDFRHIDPAKARILLVEAGPRLLAGFPGALSAYAKRALERLGVTVMAAARVDKIEPGKVTIDGQVVRAGTVVWGAGVRASPAAKWLGVEADRLGRVSVGADLSVAGIERVYVIGDTAVALGRDGKPLPGLAQVAHQQGIYLGRGLKRLIVEGKPMLPFRFHDRGNTAVIGRNAAVFDFGRWHLKGRLGWFLWGLVHVYLLTGFDKRLLVTTQWLWRYLTYETGARLISGGGGDPGG